MGADPAPVVMLASGVGGGEGQGGVANIKKDMHTHMTNVCLEQARIGAAGKWLKACDAVFGGGVTATADSAAAAATANEGGGACRKRAAS